MRARRSQPQWTKLFRSTMMNSLGWFQHCLNLLALARRYPWSVDPCCLGWCVEAAHLNWKHVLKPLWSWHTSPGNSSAAALIHHAFHTLSRAKQRRLGKIPSRDGRLSKCIFRGSVWNFFWLKWNMEITSCTCKKVLSLPIQINYFRLTLTYLRPWT